MKRGALINLETLTTSRLEDQGSESLKFAGLEISHGQLSYSGKSTVPECWSSQVQKAWVASERLPARK